MILSRLDSKIADLDREIAELDERIDALCAQLDWDPDQDRDESGKWTSGGGGGGGGKAASSGSSGGATRASAPSRAPKAKEPEEKDPDSERYKGTGIERRGFGGQKIPAGPKAEGANTNHGSVRAEKALTELKKGDKVEINGQERTALGTTTIDDRLVEVRYRGPDGETYSAIAPKVAEPPAAWKGTQERDTEAAHKSGKEYKPERVKEVHDKYTEAVTRGLPKSETPTVYMTGGGPASGKTTGLLENPKAGIPDSKAAAHIDPDGAKRYIPEYNAGVEAGAKEAAAFAHEESSHMAKNSIASALKSGHNVVYDSVGDSGIDKLEKKVNEMRAQGAKKIVANYATVDVDEAIKRSDARAERTGRFVPHAYIRAAHSDVTTTLQAAIDRGTFDELDLWDTTGREPVHVASYRKEGGGLKVLDESKWSEFKTRSGSTSVPKSKEPLNIPAPPPARE